MPVQGDCLLDILHCFGMEGGCTVRHDVVFLCFTFRNQEFPERLWIPDIQRSPRVEMTDLSIRNTVYLTILSPFVIPGDDTTDSMIWSVSVWGCC